MSGKGFLLDVNILIALLDDEHIHHQRVVRWFSTVKSVWGICAFTEAGYLRLVTNGATGRFSVPEAIHVLNELTRFPGYTFWPMKDSWISLAAPFTDRIHGPKQITDAYLLGLAVKENGVLVTLDRGIRHLAGERYSKNVLVLE